jgi:hypothetical protein
MAKTFQLSDASVKLVGELRKANLLTRVGESIQRRSVVRAASWRNALKRMLSNHWANIRLEWRNRLSFELCQRYRSQYQLWNDIALASNALLDPIIREAVERLDERLGVRSLAKKQLFYSIRIDLGGAIHEMEYTTLVPLELYRSLLPWYLDGHVACDLEGGPFSGRLVVY